MSDSRIVKGKNSRCCVGCIAGVVVLILVGVGAGFYFYQFAQRNLALMDVAAKPDPTRNTPPEVLLPKQVAGFTRGAVSTTDEDTPEVQDGRTSGAMVAYYTDGASTITVIASPVKEARVGREDEKGRLFGGKGDEGLNTGVLVRDPYSSGVTKNMTVSWSKENWSFVLQGPVAPEVMTGFAGAFRPGAGGDGNIKAAE